MQTTLIQRYLGNKSMISREIVDLVAKIAPPGALVFDAFSGSLAVSAALRAAGFEVACNDINHFSWLFARAYFSESGLPNPPGVAPMCQAVSLAFWQNELAQLTSDDMSDVPPDALRSDIFDHYCEEGSKSAFVSKRGTVGNRRFFSPQNARAIDRALTRIRYRHRAGLIGEQARCILMAALINAVEKISNTQGTYHDFPRGFIDSRALKPLTLRMPLPEIFSGPKSRFIGKAQDSLEFARNVPAHSVMYLDPPYNFRQYTSYYFMLNMLASYAEIDDIDEYFSGIQFVRGQNMDEDFKSSFCSRKDFIPSLKRLIERADSEYVILSYFDGPNHWGSFKSTEAETEGRTLLEELFRSDIFIDGSFDFTPVDRKNYQSYGGYSGKPVQEFLFVARKNKGAAMKTDFGDDAWIGQDSVSRAM